ncbi:MAG: Clp1/GlmU family protein [Candidatus Geothermarchaeales archaeon]
MILRSETVALGSGEAVLVIGSAVVAVTKGEVEIFGKRMHPGDTGVVKRYRAYPVEAGDAGAELEVRLGSGGLVQRRDRIGCGFWSSIAEEVLLRRTDLAIIGGTDTGKSSLTVFLLNRGRQVGLKVGVIDADLGQGDLGVPGTIGLAVPSDDTLSLEACETLRTFFVGKTSPYGVEPRLEEGIAALHKYSKELGCQPTITTMHGWLFDERAVNHVLGVVKQLGLRELVLLQKSSELEPLVREIGRLKEKGYGEIRMHFAPAPDTFERSSGQRRRIRERRLRSYFQKSEFVLESVDCDRREIGGAGLFEGAAWRISGALRKMVAKHAGMSRADVSYAEKAGNQVKILAGDRAQSEPLRFVRFPFGNLRVDVYSSGREMGLLVGFQITNGDWRVGKLLALDPMRRKMHLLRPADAEGWGRLLLGRMVLSGDDIEVRSLSKEFFS